MERSGIKTVVLCRQTNHKVYMCFDHCLPFRGDLKNPQYSKLPIIEPIVPSKTSSISPMLRDSAASNPQPIMFNDFGG